MMLLADPPLRDCWRYTNFSVSDKLVCSWIEMASCSQKCVQLRMSPSKLGASNFGIFRPLPSEPVDNDVDCCELIIFLILWQQLKWSGFNCVYFTRSSSPSGNSKLDKWSPLSMISPFTSDNSS